MKNSRRKSNFYSVIKIWIAKISLQKVQDAGITSAFSCAQVKSLKETYAVLIGSDSTGDRKVVSFEHKVT